MSDLSSDLARMSVPAGISGTHGEYTAPTIADAMDQQRKWSGVDAQLGGFRPSSNAVTLIQIGGQAPFQIGTNATRAPAMTNYLTQRARVGGVTAATSAALGGMRFGGAGPMMNGVNGYGMRFRAGLAQVSANMRWSLNASLSNTPTNVDPSTLTDNIGIGADAADANVQIMTCGSSGPATKIDLGSGFPARTAGAVYMMEAIMKPGGAQAYVRVHRLDTATVSATYLITAALPTATALLTGMLWCTNGADAQVVELALMDSLYYAEF